MARILVVDDDKVVRDVVSMYLTTAGHRIVSVYDGTTALEALDLMSPGSKTPIDLVVTDLNMPIINGVRLAQEIKGQYPNLPVILFTSDMPPDHKADAVVKKPDVKHLVEMVESLLKNS